MYLSRVELDIGNRQKLHDLTHVGAYHNWVEASFPKEVESGVRTRKLWRLDHIGRKTYLLVVSEEKPNLDRFEKYGVSGTAESKDYSQFLSSIKTDKPYRFKVVLNPTHSVARESGGRGKVYPHVTADKQLEFLEKKADANGFRLIPGNYQITDRSYQLLRKKGHPDVHISVVTFEGLLEVTNIELFLKAMTKGIGKEKAYGCGMLTIIPVKS